MTPHSASHHPHQIVTVWGLCGYCRSRLASLYSAPRRAEFRGSSMPRTASQISVRDYRPTNSEPFMNERQREYFRDKLVAWKEEILKEARETLQHLQDESQNHPDLADRASSETDRAIELRARDRQRKLISKIDAALAAHRRRHLRLLRGDRRADQPQASRRPSDRDAVDRGAGAPRAPRARLSRRLKPKPRSSPTWAARPALPWPFVRCNPTEGVAGSCRGALMLRGDV